MPSRTSRPAGGAAGLTDREALALSDATEKAIADTTVRLAMTRPQHAEAYKMAGFDMLWAAVTRGAEPRDSTRAPSGLDHIGRLPDGHEMVQTACARATRRQPDIAWEDAMKRQAS